MIRVCSRLVVVVICVLGFSTAAHAVPILDLFNTGVVTQGVLLPGGGDGEVDTHWDVVAGPGIVTPIDAVTYKHPSYFADGPNSRWISVNPFGGPGNASFVYQTTFTLDPLFDPALTLIQAQCAADNSVSGVTLNGSPVGGAVCDGFDAFDPAFSITSGFIPGTNTLQFTAVDGGPPGAFRAEFTSRTELLEDGDGEILPVPEPASMLLLGSGLAAMGLFRGRRSSFRRRA